MRILSDAEKVLRALRRRDGLVSEVISIRAWASTGARAEGHRYASRTV